MSDFIEEIRCALAMREAGYDALLGHEATAELLRRHDVMVKALETAAARFNMMGGVGLVNGADPKVGYRECMDVLAVVGNAPDSSNRTPRD